MKNKCWFRSFSMVLVLVVLMLSLASCAVKVKDSSFYYDNSYINDITFLNKDGEKQGKSFTGVDGDWFDITFDEQKTVDTIILKEKDNNVKAFEIYAKLDGEFVLIYQQDLIGEFRYCAFSDTQTDALRVKITETVNGTFKLESINALNSTHTNDDFRITTYVVADRIYDVITLDSSHFNVITDVILFGTVTFDENGSLSLRDFEIDGNTVTGSDVLKTAINNIKSVSNRKNIKFYINLLGPSGSDDDEKQELHTECFKNHSDALINNVNSLLAEYGVDGIYFDYEFPYKSKHMKEFSKFLVKLDEGITENKEIGLALAPWGHTLSAKAKESVDFIEVMAYDLFDENGYHSTFASQGGVLSLDYFNSKGYDIKKCDLGVPFYSRPLDGDGIWLDYKSAYQKLGKYGNVDDSTVYVDEERAEYSIARYYNSYQMIFDKTAFAYDYGTGGMMIWHYSCDVDTDTGLSLFDAMEQAIVSRSN